MCNKRKIVRLTTILIDTAWNEETRFLLLLHHISVWHLRKPRVRTVTAQIIIVNLRRISAYDFFFVPSNCAASVIGSSNVTHNNEMYHVEVYWAAIYSKSKLVNHKCEEVLLLLINFSGHELKRAMNTLIRQIKELGKCHVIDTVRVIKFLKLILE